MFAQPDIAWYQGRHGSNGHEDHRWLIELVVAILTMIAAFGAWLHPFVPNDPKPAPSRSAGVPSSPVSTKAVDFALSQIGARYVYGATGPYKTGYDDSGLAEDAWAHAGVMIPRTRMEDWEWLYHIPKADIQPGDLIFFYTDISHVSIYIGHGDIIDSPGQGSPGQGQEVDAVPLSKYANIIVGAARP